LRTSEELIQKPPSLTSLQNETTAARNEIRAIRTQLATTVHQQNLDHATSAEEKDGRVNEKYVLFDILNAI
jgi:hypothetical protein